jgi:uncharacterized protein (TIGR00730 family)
VIQLHSNSIGAFNLFSGEDMKSICVFAGANSGLDGQYLAGARNLGRAIAARGWGLVYGGGRTGLMGALADAALEAGGDVTGVIPQFLVDKEIAHTGLTKLHVVGSMHERKALLANLSDGFVMLPGGIGTFEELFEVWTWGQLGSHDKPCGALNVAGFYTPLLAFLDEVVANAFLTPEHREMLQVSDDANDLLGRFLTYEPPVVSKWMAREET